MDRTRIANECASVHRIYVNREFNVIVFICLCDDRLRIGLLRQSPQNELQAHTHIVHKHFAYLLELTQRKIQYNIRIFIDITKVACVLKYGITFAQAISLKLSYNFV